MSFSPAQCRAARGLLGWSQAQLAEASKVATKTIADFERESRMPYDRTLADVQRAFEAAGVEFTNGGQPGVRMRNDLIKLQFRNALLRGKITTALKGADDALQHADDKRAKLLAKISEDSVETLADVFENLR